MSLCENYFANTIAAERLYVTGLIDYPLVFLFDVTLFQFNFLCYRIDRRNTSTVLLCSLFFFQLTILRGFKRECKEIELLTSV